MDQDNEGINITVILTTMFICIFLLGGYIINQKTQVEMEKIKLRQMEVKAFIQPATTQPVNNSRNK